MSARLNRCLPTVVVLAMSVSVVVLAWRGCPADDPDPAEPPGVDIYDHLPYAKTVLSLHNSARREAGLAPVGLDEELCEAAQNDSYQLTAGRSRLSGFPVSIATGPEKAADAMAQWMGDPEARSKILDPGVRAIGVSLRQTGGSHWWVVVYADGEQE